MRKNLSPTDANYSAIQAKTPLERFDTENVKPYGPTRSNGSRGSLTAAAILTLVVISTGPYSAFAPDDWSVAPDDWSVTNKTGVSVDAAANGEQEDRYAVLAAEVISFKHLPDGWDGDKSHPPSQSAVDDALAFIDLLPPNTKLEAMASADGEVGFYCRTADGYVDVGFKGDNSISYFARADGLKAKDVKSFRRRSIPKDLLEVIAKV